MKVERMVRNTLETQEGDEGERGTKCSFLLSAATEPGENSP